MFRHQVEVRKTDEAERLVFGWGSVVADDTGHPIVDSDGDVIAPEDLEKAVYDFVAESGASGVEHRGEAVAEVVESLVMTKQKAEAMGLPGPPATGWWVGIKLADADMFAKVRDGTYTMFSIEGTAVRTRDEQVAET